MEILTKTKVPALEESLVQVVYELAPEIAEKIDEKQRERKLSQQVVSALKEAGLYRMFLPKSLGGFEADPVTVAEVVEEVSRHNTAAGWSLMVANTITWWGGRLSEKGIDELFQSGPDTFIAGSVHPPMKATRVEGGFVINGRNPLISNVHEAQWIFVLGLIMEKDQVKMSDGHPEIVGVFMKREDCEIADTWYTFGMCATDSNDVIAKDVFVPDHLQFPMTPPFEPNTHYKSPLYRFPANGACVACLIAPVSLALADKAISELKKLAQNKMPLGSSVPIKERGVVQRKLGMAQALLQSSRAYLYREISESWRKTLAGQTQSIEEKAGLLLAAAHANQSCFQAVDMMYSAAGTNAIYTRNKLGHYFADAQVLRQHGFINDSRYETAGQVMFGLPPDVPIIVF